MDTPFYVQPIMAWRAWGLQPDPNPGDTWWRMSASFSDAHRRVEFVAGIRQRPALSSIGIGRIAWTPRQEIEAVCLSPRYVRFQHGLPVAAATLQEALAAIPADRRSPHASPEPTCGCGIWGLNDRRHVEQAISQNPQHGIVIGIVALWGRVIECERGFRAERAYPVSLTLISPRDSTTDIELDYDQVADRLAERYGVPCIHEPEPAHWPAVRAQRELYHKLCQEAAKQKLAESTKAFQTASAALVEAEDKLLRHQRALRRSYRAFLLTATAGGIAELAWWIATREPIHLAGGIALLTAAAAAEAARRLWR